MNEIVKKLIPLGLSEKEAQVYVALLSLGRSSAYGIATKAGVKKPTTYVILGQLIEKGLVIEVPREKKQLFAARPPDDFVTQAKQKVLEAERLLPQLSALYKNIDIEKARTMYFEGINGLRQALWYKEKEMRGKELIGFFASGKQASKEMYDLFDEWNHYYVTHGIAVRGLTTYDESLETLLQKYGTSSLKNIRFLPLDKYTANVSIDAGDDFVRVDLIGATQAVIIESKEFAQMFRQVFELVWNSDTALSYEEVLKEFKKAKRIESRPKAK